jgi:MoxR-like ATPase
VSVGSETLQKLVGAVEQVLVGKHAEAELAIIGLAAAGHLLIEDVPGVGKTMLAKSLARATGSTFKRIQFTPDLLPTDVTGVSIYNQRTGEFEFRAGPIVAHVVLADEINRATPKTQSALLEAMEEHQVTVEGVTRPLPSPFMVLATQNPIEYEGTFPLPEAQLDRFLLRIHLGYPEPSQEVAVLQRQMLRHPIDDLGPVTTASELQQLQQAVRGVHIDAQIQRYIVHVVGLTRDHPDVYLGASPRGSLALMRASQARAMLAGREYVIPDDIKVLATAALAHRLIMSPEARMRNATALGVVNGILQEVPVPGSRVPA